MLISCNRLKNYIKNSEDIDFLKLWDKFTIRTAEVEEVKVVGNNFDGVVVAQIVDCKEHPDSDHMHVLMVDYGEKEPIQVVCGAPNVRKGLKTCFVKVGGHIDGIEIKPRPLRGIVSNGMCCSGKELGISDNHDGILELPDDYPIGKDIKELWPIDDIIVEIDNKSLTNRPDLWGHYGIAREVAAITEHELLPLEVEEIKNDKDDLDIVIKNPELCYRYCGLTVENIKNNKTPMDMQIFLYYAGMRSISLLVDLTNFIMLELGQPMHAFDKRVVKSLEIGLAKDGDTYTTLDGTERKLTSDNLMIKNGDKYFAIAGVMGGLDSEILPDTDSLFLESATFDPGSIRKTAISLGLRTEASARYEKSLDPNMADLAIKRFVYLLHKENKDMQITSNLTDIYPHKLEEGHISLTKRKLAIYMGKTLDDNVVKNILERIGFKVEVKEATYEVTVPTFRHSKDVNIEEDLIEEVSRFYGLENFGPSPLCLELSSKEQDTIYNEEYDVKYLLANKFDMNEVHSYVWYDTNMLKDMNIEKKGVKLLGKEQNNILRDDLPFSLLNIVSNNLKNFNTLRLFEIGTTIVNNQNERHLAVIYADDEKNIETIYNEAKNMVKVVFNNLKNLKAIFKDSVNEKEYYDNTLGKVIMVNNEAIGTLNVLNKACTNKIAKKKALVLVDIDFDKYVTLEASSMKVKEISKYPSVNLDYTLIASKDTKYALISQVIDTFKNNIINSSHLVGVYEDDKNKKYTISFNVGSKDKTLTQEDLTKFKEKFIKHIKENDLDIIE